MAAIAAISSIVFSRHISNSSQTALPRAEEKNFKFSSYSNPLKLHICSIQYPIFSINPPRIHPTTKPIFRICSIAESVEVEENTETIPQENQKRKLYIHNLPWTMTVVDIKNLFGECGTVVDVEIIKQKNGKSRGFAFVTMANGEEGQAAVEKFDAYEVSGRIIRVEFAKRLKKPPKPPLPEDPPRRETLHKLYLSNLAWKVRSSHLREFVSAFNPVGARVVFASPGKSAGYGFVSFSTKEEAEAAILSLDGKELLNRAVRLKVSESKDEVEENSTEKIESENKAEEVTENVVSENEVQETVEEKLGDS